jgi:hypothetical protein
MKYTHRVLTARYGPPGYVTNTLSGETMADLYPVIPVIESWDHAEIPEELLNALSVLRQQELSYYRDGQEGAIWSEVYVIDHAVELADKIKELVTTHPPVFQ